MSSPLLELAVQRSWLRKTLRWFATPRGMLTALSVALCGLLVPLPDLPDFVSPFFNIAHVAMFGLLAWVVRTRLAARFPSGWTADLLTLAIGAFIGAAGEIAQRWIPGRDASFQDEWFDLVGLMLSLIVYRFGADVRDRLRPPQPAGAAPALATDAPIPIGAALGAQAQRGGSVESASLRLSVVIPTYNRRDDVQRAIDSVLQQGDALLQIVIVDDGSTDDTDIALRRYRDDSRVQCVRTANHGVSAARNRGLALAHGDIVLFLDSDDWLLPGTLEFVHGIFAEHSALQFVYVEGRTEAKPGHPARLQVAREECPGWLNGDVTSEAAFVRHRVAGIGAGGCVSGTLSVGDFFPAIVRGGLFFLSGLFMRREAALAAGGFDERYRLWEDWDFHVRLCLQGPGGYVDHAGFCRDTGRGDQLSDALNALRFASMYRRIVRGLAASGRVRGAQAQQHLSGALADADYWWGRCLLRTRHRRFARRWLLQSLLRPYKPLRSGVWLIRSFLP